MNKTLRIAITALLAGLVAIVAAPLLVEAGTTAGQYLFVLRSGNTNPTCATATVDGELCAAGDIESNGNLDIAGTSTLTGAVTITADAILPTGSISSGEIAANTIVSADIDQNVIQVDNTQLTNAQVLAVRATPITLISAPAANTSLWVHMVCVVLDAAAGAYTESADDLAIEFAGGTDIVNIDSTDGFDDAAVTKRCYTPSHGSEVTTLAAANVACNTTCGGLKCEFGSTGALLVDCADATADSCVCRFYSTPTAATAIQVINTGDGELGGGNAANTLSIRIWYSLIPTIAFSSGG